MKKLFIITRKDLPAGLQVAQSCHALQAFNDQHTALAKAWTGNLVCLATSGAEALGELACNLGRRYKLATFHEPDLGGELTAVAIEGSARRKLSNLPLALKTV